MHPPFPQERWPRNSQELLRYNPYIHSGQDLQCSIMQQYRTENWENTKEEPKWLSEKSIHIITNFDYPSNSRCSCKNPGATLLFIDFSKAFDSMHRGKMEQILLAFNLPKKTITVIMVLYKTPLTGWRHKQLRHCSRCAARRYISPIPVYYLSRLCA